jgi:hypothetical protein
VYASAGSPAVAWTAAGAACVLIGFWYGAAAWLAGHWSETVNLMDLAAHDPDSGLVRVIIDTPRASRNSTVRSRGWAVQAQPGIAGGHVVPIRFRLDSGHAR